MPNADVWRAWSELQTVRALLCHFPGRPDLLAREGMAVEQLARAEAIDAAATDSPTV